MIENIILNNVIFNRILNRIVTSNKSFNRRTTLSKFLDKYAAEGDIANSENNYDLKKAYEALINTFLEKPEVTDLDDIPMFQDWYINNIIVPFKEELIKYIENDLTRGQCKIFGRIIESHPKYETLILNDALNHYKDLFNLAHSSVINEFLKTYDKGERTINNLTEYLDKEYVKTLIINDFAQFTRQHYKNPVDVNKIRTKIYQTVYKKILFSSSIDIYLDDQKFNTDDSQVTDDLAETVLHANYHDRLRSPRKIPLSAYTNIGLKLIDVIKTEFNSLKFKYQNSYLFAAQKWKANILGKNLYIIVQQTNQAWSKNDVIYFVNHVINDIIRPEYKDRVNEIELVQKFAKTIKKHLSEIIPKIKDRFPKHDNGYYQHTWLDSDADERWEAEEVLNYIPENDALLETICKEAFNVDTADLMSIIPLQKLLKICYDNTDIMDDLHLAVRKYLVRFNRDINVIKSNEVASNNDSIVAKFDENGELIIPDNAPSITLDFDPRDDSQRERPIVIIREYIHKNENEIDKNNFKDHVVVGRPGANHGSILKAVKYQSLLENSMIDSNPTIACCYAVGKIAIIDNMRMFFPSVEEVKKALEHSGKFKKVYVYPRDDKVIYRVAKRRLGLLIK